ncbi:MAG: type II toxin-antitoxin system VapB family antitoxin [Deltaproteobacteria bacterium]|nr:type II toxin-antitoxin system VapB family antitoxin [Deltaproteobacteria bacterium]
MSTNLAIDDKLIEDARLVGQHRTKKAVVTEALQEYIQRRVFGLWPSAERSSRHRILRLLSFKS